ncbi:hypothetical protein CROQUDRAFT_43831 [Cronartium quercuum f. sp. fusiforme G11]|uniref:Sas10 C-terminal domain-containing protein n=1 Tax=Cronartium quercuum f. sp. fusiforme G11 TaxID=708437 RepID=A0A9P6TBY6_9BASI|nr:hypothetical protein CROQUDRAFT_43831 [Cronartium quercuum f. sp. fusiforme G11]
MAQNVRPLSDGYFDTKKSRIKALNDWNDEDMQDDEDQFLAGNDQVLFDDTTSNRDLEHDLDIPRQLLEIDSENEEDTSEEDLEMDEPAPRVFKQRKSKPIVDNTQKGRFGKASTVGLLDESDGSDIADDQDQESKSSEFENGTASEGSEDEVWKSYHVKSGPTKKSRKRIPQDPESKAEEATRRQLELDEVKRLQVKARSKLIRSDFISYLDYASDSEVAEPQVTPEENAIDLLQFSSQKFESEPEAIALMLKTKPEVLALVNDYQRNLVTLAELKADVLGAIQANSDPEQNVFNQAIGCLQYHVLSTYLSTAAFYLHLSLKTSSTTTPVMGEVMKALVELRTTLNNMDDNGLTGDSLDEELEDMSNLIRGYEGDSLSHKFAQELKALQDDNEDEVQSSSRKVAKKSKRVTEGLPRSALTTAQQSSTKKKKRKRAAREPKIEDPNLALSSLPERPSLNSLTFPDDSNDNDFLEATSLTSSEAREKMNGKRDLRFYTAKIDAKGKRREKAIRGLDGTATGDSDLPYQTKESRRREFLQNQDHGEMDGSGEDEEGFDVDSSFAQDNDPDQSMDYYETVKELKESAKIAKKAKYDEERLAERNALSTEGETGSGPRQATRQILKNKGLTPKRAKVNRNPRVKKRLRFEKANKKISSQRPTYKSDLASKSREMNGYSGERSGVKVGIVKSRKL